MAIDPKFKEGPGGFYNEDSGAGPYFIDSDGVVTLMAAGDPIPADLSEISLGPGGFYINSTGAGPYAWDGVNLFMIGSQGVPESPFLKGEERVIWARARSDIPEGWSFSEQVGDEVRVQVRENHAPDTWPAVRSVDKLIPVLDGTGEPTGEYFCTFASGSPYIYGLHLVDQDGVTIIDSLPNSEPVHSGFFNIDPISLPGGRLLVLYNAITGDDVPTTRKMDIFDLNTGLWEQMPDPPPGKDGVRDRYIAGAYSKDQRKVFFARESGYVDTLDIDGMTWDLEVHYIGGFQGNLSIQGVAEIVRVDEGPYSGGTGGYAEALILGVWWGSGGYVYVIGPLNEPYLMDNTALLDVEYLQILSDPSSASQGRPVWILGNPEGDFSNRTLYALRITNHGYMMDATVERSVLVPWLTGHALKFDSTENKITALAELNMGTPTLWGDAPVRNISDPYIAEIDLSAVRVKVVKD